MGSEGLKPLTLRAAAREIGVTHRTLGIWISNGEGPRAFRYTHPTGRVTVRINQTDWRAFMQKHLSRLDLKRNPYKPAQKRDSRRNHGTKCATARRLHEDR